MELKSKMKILKEIWEVIVHRHVVLSHACHWLAIALGVLLGSNLASKLCRCPDSEKLSLV